MTAALSFSKLFKGVCTKTVCFHFYLPFINSYSTYTVSRYYVHEHLVSPIVKCLSFYSPFLNFSWSVSQPIFIVVCVYRCVAVIKCWELLFWVIFPKVLGSWWSKCHRNYINMLVSSGSSRIFSTVTVVLQNYTASYLKEQRFLYSLL